MITGGSNYITIGGQMDNPVIGTFHRFPDVVESNLREMYEHGQRKIALVLWFAPVNFPEARDNLWHHCVNSYGGVLCDQHRDNVVNLLALIEATGFKEVLFRFAAQGNAWDREWSAWSPTQFGENWEFVRSVRDLVAESKGTLNVVFDLGVEYANEQINQSQVHNLYCRQMWKRYTALYGVDDSCAYSILHGGDGLNRMLRMFKTAKLPFPACYCFDSYGFEYQSLVSAKDVLGQYGEILKPIYILETHYNDPISCADVRRAVSETGMNFKGIIQWPKERGTDGPRNDVSFPRDYMVELQDSIGDVFPRRYDNYLVE